MYYAKRISFVLIAGIFLFCNASYAQIKYSIGPTCDADKEAVCSKRKEVPTCVALNPVRIELIDQANGEKGNRYQLSCSSDNFLPCCIDTLTQAVTKEVVPECIEFVEYETDKNTNETVAVCSDGKIPTYLGDTRICDYAWGASVPSFSYR